MHYYQSIIALQSLLIYGNSRIKFQSIPSLMIPYWRTNYHTKKIILLLFKSYHSTIRQFQHRYFFACSSYFHSNTIIQTKTMPSISLSPSTAVPSSSFVTYSSQAKQHQHQHEQQNQQESKHQLVPEENSINDLNEMELDALNNSSDSDSSHKKKQKFHINDGAKCKNKKDINPSVVPVNRIIEEECVRSSNDLNTSTMLDDDPCWGTPSQCSLKDLLKFIKKDTSIIYECSNYIVLNKPPDLRMDGPYLATVHKLLTYWYPSQSILQQIMTTDNEEQQNMNEQQLQDVKYPQHHLNNNYNDQLLFYISNLKNYSETIDNELR